jgi:ParB-like chromosome segregation protein Spo0J
MSKQYAFHPLADIFPLMQGEEFDALVADINANGLRERIDKYRGKIVDGRNRYRALLQLGIDPSADEKKYFRNVIYRHPMGGGFAPCDDASVLAYVVSKNIHRRHLTADQKRDLIAKLIKAEPTKSNRQIGKQVVASHPHVAKVRAEMEKTSDVETVTTSVDTKGRKRSAKRKTKRPPTEDDFHKQMADQELNLRALTLIISGKLAVLREFATFILTRTQNVSVAPGRDLAEWKVLRGKVKVIMEDEVKAMSEIAP